MCEGVKLFYKKGIKMEDWKIEAGWDKMSIPERIEFLEKTGRFDVDAFDNPPTIELKPNKIDYLREKPISKIKTAIANFMAKRYINNLIKKKQLIIKEIVGLENFEGLNGAVITCNHFNAHDNFTIQKVFEKVQKKGQKMWKIIREGNYTNPPCLDFFFKNCDTMPLSQNIHTMGKFLKSTKKALDRGDYLLIYPEESMWIDYTKPKPLKEGAFNLAVRSNCPVLPIFITLKDSEIENGQGGYVKEYTVNILPPIYPKQELSKRENILDMMSQNYDAWVEVYERTYGKKLEYTTLPEYK